MYHVNEADV